MTRRVLFGVVLLSLTLVASAWGRGAPAIPPGTPVQVRMIDTVSSDTAKPGQTFRATLQQPIVVNGATLYPKGADVTGRVVRSHSSGRLSDPGELELVLTAVRSGSSWTALNTQPFLLKGASHTKNNLGKIGGGAAAGTIIGAIAGGGKGAAIGAGVGAGSGTVWAAATGKKEAKVESEAVLAFVTASQPTNAPAAMYSRPQPDRYRERHHGDDDDEDRDHEHERYRRDDHRGGYADYGVFSERDRGIIRSCYSGGRSGLPPGLAKKDRLPPGLEKQLQRNGTLPPGLQKRVQPLPGVCTSQLAPLPGGWERVVLSGRVILLGGGNRIMDMFYLESDD